MLFIIIGIIIGAVILYLYFGIKKGDNATNFLWSELKKYNINKENVKLTIGNYIPENCFIYSDNNQLFFINHKRLELSKIEIKDILEIIIESKYEYNGKQKIMTVVPQMNIQGKEIETIFKVITTDRIYRISTNCGYKDNMIRLKAILEKEMKEVE